MLNKPSNYHQMVWLGTSFYSNALRCISQRNLAFTILRICVVHLSGITAYLFFL
jgi:hypothetical protein